MSGFDSRRRHFISVCNQPPRSIDSAFYPPWDGNRGVGAGFVRVVFTNPIFVARKKLLELKTLDSQFSLSILFSIYREK